MIVVKVEIDKVNNLVKQIEKQVDVIKAFYHTDEETIYQESALYKVKSNSLFEERQIQNIIKQSHANPIKAFGMLILCTLKLRELKTRKIVFNLFV